MEWLTRRARATAPLLAYLAAAYAAAGAGGAITARSLGPWYAGLRKSRLNPPSWVFGPVWTTLYTLMAVAAWLVARERQTAGTEEGTAGSRDYGAGSATWALAAWWVQLGLNLGWSALFFGLRAPGAALAEIVALWAAIAACVRFSARVSTAAAWLLVPYLAWTTFAAYLNLRIYQRNRP